MTCSRHRYWLHILLFLVTLYTTSAVGARFVSNFNLGLPVFVLERDLMALAANSTDLGALLSGLPFSLTLLTILLAHEMGHYFACVRYRLDATLPYFLPAPTFIGTFGAFIRIRSIIYSRKVLFDVGAAGPFAGFVALLPALLVGVSMSKVVPGIASTGDIAFGTPLLLTLFERLFFPGVASADIYLHPVARAAWVGLFATALNLLPIGQLDGGHIVYAIAASRHKLISRIAIAVLVLMGYLFWWVWYVWAAALFWLGRKHPFIHDETPVGANRVALGLLAFAIFLVSFMPAPIH